MATLNWTSVQDFFNTFTINVFQCKVCPNFATTQRDKGITHILDKHALMHGGMIIVVNNSTPEAVGSNTLLELCNQCENGLASWSTNVQDELSQPPAQKQFVDAATETDLTQEVVSTDKPDEETLPALSSDIDSGAKVTQVETERVPKSLRSIPAAFDPMPSKEGETLITDENDGAIDSDGENYSNDGAACKLYDSKNSSKPESTETTSKSLPDQSTIVSSEAKEQEKDTNQNENSSGKETAQASTQSPSSTRTGLRSPAKRKRKVFHDCVEEDNHLTSDRPSDNRKSVSPLKCDKCDLTTDNLKDLKRHQSTHTNGKRMKQTVCLKCNKEFSNKRGLRLHGALCERKESDSENVADDEKNDRDKNSSGKLQSKAEQKSCPVCNFLCKSERGYKIHMYKHAETRKSRTFECDECSKKFTTKQGMLKHKSEGWCRKGMPKTYKRYKCSICEKEYINKAIYQEHLTVHSAIRSHTCDVCKRSFKTARALKRHRSMHGGEPLKCNLCDFTTYWKTSLKTHYVGKHNSESRPLQKCPHCEFTTRSAMYISKHIMLHSEDRPYMCEQCGKSFKSDVVLRAHRETHSETTYPCDKCDYVGRTKAAIYNHQTCHIPKEQMQFKCSLCDWRGKRNTEYQIHLRKHSDMKLFRCGHCGHSYKHKQGLTRHLKEKHMVQATVIPEVIFPGDDLETQEASLALSSLPVAQFFEISTEILADPN